jgi:outer membrane protein OmpA-like peptidoglycan-associated protein
LRSIVAELEANPGLKLVIEGHTDGTGGEDINQDLSCRRANNTRDALLNLGIVESRLEISCEGKERPLATNDDEFEGRELNRRVEFYLF